MRSLVPDAGKWVVEEIVDPVTNKVTVAIQWVSEKQKKLLPLPKKLLLRRGKRYNNILN